ncbi:MAG: type II toxin-antitoxin system RelE/ParE family toxin [Lachnospiraceae bacterium]|nr:type II toxin-antitoxin system RelE/ParE family toxin [Lachnospiraceae bacterium]
MFNIEFYENVNGESDVKDFLRDLRNKAKSNKDARINFEKAVAYIDALEEAGTRIGQPITKHLEGEIWELRPLSNRILYAYYENNTYVLLHHFVKKTQKTPRREIEKAIKEIDDFKRRHKTDEHMERI